MDSRTRPKDKLLSSRLSRYGSRVHTLGERLQGRDNNLNLIRVLAASAVLIGHSYELAAGQEDPMEALTATSMGGIAVEVFFVISGFLVTASLIARENLLDFIVARFLRIYPGLIAVVVLTVLWCGTLTTSPDYFTDAATFSYLLHNIPMIFGDHQRLPGVFETNITQNVNGSLWTLPWELRLYLGLAVLWMGLSVAGPFRKQMFPLTVLAVTAASLYLVWSGNRLITDFFLGASFYVLRDKVPLSGALALCAAAAGIIGLTTGWMALYVLALPYVVLWLAYIPGGLIRRYNAAGDYSYGIYIYGAVVQQSVAALLPDISIWGMSAIAGCVTLFLAWCSWHFLEHRALRQKERATRLLRSRLVPKSLKAR